MGEDFVEREFKVPAGNARRNGGKLFEIVQSKVSDSRAEVSSPLGVA
jgi:hypothetical protein